ncbi:MAG: carotenoid oxygenase family protein, partial [Myxococcales bacterium]|nr:carotenoid oxygenase family protein [Myxococcales bacterium]
LELEGELPEGLQGTLFRNGPASFDSFGVRYGHWFDGDGAVSACRVRGGEVTGAIRFVESADRAEEREAGEPLFPGFGTRAPSLRSHIRSVIRGRVKSVANTNVLPWQGRLLALHEGSRPIGLEPETLETLGPTDLDGTIGRAMSAHPHRVAAHRCTYNIGLIGGKSPTLEILAMPDAGPLRRLGSLPLGRMTMIHDFIATERHLLILISPVFLRPLDMILKRRPFVESLAWQPEVGTEVIAVPITNPGVALGPAKRFFVEPFFQFHFANAFEASEAGDDIIVDLVQYPDFPAINSWIHELTRPAPMHTAIDGTLVRGRLDLRRQQLRFESVHPSCEFSRVAPAVDGRRHRFVYLGCHAQRSGVRPGMQDHLAKVDMERGESWAWDFGDETYPSEPVFVADPARGDREDGGWLVTIVYDGERDRSCFAVVDAERPQRGVLARAWFDQHLPPTFHGNWSPAL